MNNFAEKELVVLKKELDDSNYSRIYEVLKVYDDTLDVSVIAETKKKNKYANPDNKILGKTFNNVEKTSFEALL